ncbi:MAG: protein translocase subunit SecD, partial [Clostridiales bacterium]|nr:protein translocase subunit SecD [Clostridiales bacterium]
MKNNNALKIIILLAVIVAAMFFSVSPITGSPLLNINLGIDLQGGVQVILQAIPAEGETISSDDMDKLTAVIRKRVDALGVSEPIIQKEGSDRLLVGLAGINDPERARELLGRTAKLEFRKPDGTVIVTGADLKNVRNPQLNEKSEWEIPLEFTHDGSVSFTEAANSLRGQYIDIYLDDELISSPGINLNAKPFVVGNPVVITTGGNFQQAYDLSSLLKGGALPVDIDPNPSVRIIEASLGRDSLDKSLTAVAIGLIVLLLAMMAYYRLPGVLANISLVVYALLLLWALKLLNATLTLAGIAGFVLSIGMAVDANIIIYERIKEELKAGKSLRAAIETGFKRAFWTIFDSNLTTLLVALVLIQFGSGAIRGFAVTLSLGLLASMFTAITFTRIMLRWVCGIKAFSNKKLYMGKMTDIKQRNVIGRRKTWYIVSLLVIVPGIVSLFVQGLNLGIDFTGGNKYELSFAQPVEQADVLRVASAHGDKTPSVTKTGEGNYIIRTSFLSEQEGSALLADLRAQLGDFTKPSEETVGPVIGKDLTEKAFIALALALILILVYIAFRFKFNFGIAAIAAQAHDVLVTLSVVSLFRIEVDSSFIAAILTIVGYSLNNTIVIFDRIRENMPHAKKGAMADLVNTSVLQTLRRSINTVVAVLILLAALLIFGGATTKIFIL